MPQDVAGGYGLMFDEDRQFITEENRHSVKQGFLLVLTASPVQFFGTRGKRKLNVQENYARTLLANLDTTDASKYHQVQKSLTSLVSLSSDTAFAKELHRQDGIRKLVSIIEEGLYDAYVFVDATANGPTTFRNVMCLCQILQAFLILMGQSGLLDWSELSPKFVERISAYVNGGSKIENNDSLYLALSIVQNIFTRWYIRLVMVLQHSRSHCLANR